MGPSILMRSVRPRAGRLPALSARPLPLLRARTRRSSTATSPPSDETGARNHRDDSSAANAAASPSDQPFPTGIGRGRRPRKPLTDEQRAFLSAALRVNHAGELAAVRIYEAQTPPVVAREPHLRPLMRHMREQEEGHLATFEQLLARHRVRPTALYPVWAALATGLGWATGVLGREAAMACTEAVETEIGGHYNDQIRRLLAMVGQWEAEGYEVGEELGGLVATLRRIRDEELEHLDHAVEHDAKKAQPHWLLTGVIRAGCRGAIWVSERV